MAFPCEPVVETRFDIFTEYAREQPIGKRMEMGERAGTTAESFFLVPTLQRGNTARMVRVRSGVAEERKGVQK